MAHELETLYCDGSMGGLPCPITSRSHERGFLFLGVVHFRERRFTRRGAKHFLMLVAEDQRRRDPAYINDDRLFGFWYVYHDAVKAQELAGRLGFRLPSRLFAMDRARCRWLARKSKVRMTRRVRAWAAA